MVLNLIQSLTIYQPLRSNIIHSVVRVYTLTTHQLKLRKKIMYLLVDKNDNIMAKGNTRGMCFINCNKVRINIVEQDDLKILRLYSGQGLNEEVFARELTTKSPLPTALNYFAKDLANAMGYKLYKVTLINW